MRKLFIISIIILLALLSFVAIRRMRKGPETNGTTPAGGLYVPGNYNESITVDGRERTYLLHVPKDFNAKKQYALLFGFHGGAGTGEKFARQTDFREKADAEGFIAAFPDGIEHNWNDGRDTTDAYKAGVDDIKFIRALVANLEDKLPIDKKAIYAAGVSNGGIFVHRLACEAADIFAAVGADVGAIATNLVPKCNPAKPISLVAIQGDADPFIPIQGGEEGWKSGRGDGGLLESAESTRTFWARKNGCTAEPTTIEPRPLYNDGTSFTLYQHENCRGGTAVSYYIVHGMGHVWPPKGGQAPRVSGPTSKNLNATDVIWEFFKGHARAK